MIVSFTVANYKAFKEAVTLDMRGASTSKPGDARVIDAGKLRLLKSAAIYGPNASGKSKLLEAMRFMRDFVLRSSKDTQSSEAIFVDPFRLSTETREKPSHFEMEFLLDGVQHRYGFEANSERVTKEWLFFRPGGVAEKPLFARVEDDIEIAPSRFKEGKGVEKRTRSNALFLSSVAQWNGELAGKIVGWFGKMLFISRRHWFEADELFSSEEMLHDPDFKRFAENALKMASLQIEGIELEEEAKENGGFLASALKEFEKRAPSGKPGVVARHPVFDAEGNMAGEGRFSLWFDESEGTEKFFILLGTIYQALKHGKMLVCDELESSFHPLLVRAVVLLFNSAAANREQSQFIFTTHDTNLIDSDILSRDQIWFLEKNRFGASRLYSLVEFKTRKEVNHEREYFMGRYGAIPFIENLEKAFEPTENGKAKTSAKAA